MFAVSLASTSCLDSALNPDSDLEFPDIPANETDDESKNEKEKQNEGQEETGETNRKIRRLTLDLLHRLPTASEISNYNNSPDLKSDILSMALGNPALYAAIAETHRSFWKLQDREALTDLSLPDTSAENYSDDTVETLKFHLSAGTQFSDLFSLDYSITSSDSATNYGVSTTSGPVPGTEYIDYFGKRPSFGLASSLGMTASIGSNQDGTGNNKAYSLLQKLACIDYSGDDSHNFNILPEEYIQANIRSVSLVQPECASCHAQYGSLTTSVPLFASKTNLSDWIAYSSDEFTPGTYAGHDFTTESQLVEFIKNDPRIKTCEIVNLVEELLQRPFESFESRRLYALLFNSFEEHQSIEDLVAQIINESSYLNSLNIETSNKDATTEGSVKLLSRHHLKGIVRALSMTEVSFDLEQTDLTLTPNQIALPVNLDVKKPHISSGNSFLPDETYLRSIYRLANDFSLKIVTDELSTAPLVLSNSRKVLKQIPDGDGSSATDIHIQNQIITLWFDMTSQLLQTTDTKYIQLKSLYDTISQTSTTEAWRAVIYAIIVSPEFLTF